MNMIASIETSQQLPASDDGLLPHITWCATGPFAFLPLHAAGIYASLDSKKKVNLSDFAVSSYTTNLSHLLVAGSKHRKKHPRVLAISQPYAQGFQDIPKTVTEVEGIKKYLPQEQLHHLNSNEATVDAVLEQMRHHEWIHLACHGLQDVERPLECAFVLHDDKLKLERLMAQSLENAELAVLSACQTATGDQTLPEESLHLAAGMLSVGYPNVIATMWAIHDSDGPIMTSKLYEYLFKYQELGLSPAYALHEAMKHLKEKIGVKEFERWVPFVHFGL